MNSSGMGWGYSNSHNNAPQNGSVNANGQVSVVATVWGVTTSTQSGPMGSFANTGHPAGNFCTSQSSAYASSQPIKGNFNGPNGMSVASGARHVGFSGGYGQPQQNQMMGHHAANDYSGAANTNALNAATLVAAATATATATARVVALQERQEAAMNSMNNSQSVQYQQQGGMNYPTNQTGYRINSHVNPMAGPNQNMHSQQMASNHSAPNMASMQHMNNHQMSSGPANMPPNNSMMAGGPMKGPIPSGYPVNGGQSRVRPYQVPSANSQYPLNGPKRGYNSTANYGHQQSQPMYNQQQQSYPGNQFTRTPGSFKQGTPYQGQSYGPQSAIRGPSNYMGNPGQQMPGNSYPTQGVYSNGPQQSFDTSNYNVHNGSQYNGHHANNGQSPYPPPQQPNAYMGNSGMNGNTRGYHHQHSPIPGNPTPPLTPASSVSSSSTPYGHGPDVKPFIGNTELKPPLPPHKDDELRLTFPVRDGVILAPFRLEHNLAVSNHFFMLKPSVQHTLMTRPDLELQLKCFHHEDKLSNTNWPASVQVTVNATPLTIDRGIEKSSHKPLYLKSVCQAERNTIQITVSACCCSHLFVLQLVHRPTVKSILQGLLRKRLLPAESCIAKIKRHFSSASLPPGSMGSDVHDGIEQTAIKVSLKCPISFKRISLPARGSDCKHIPCFDLETYLEMNADRGLWRCPICNKPALLEGLEIDQYIWGILSSTANVLSRNGHEIDEVTIDTKANWASSCSKMVGVKEEVDTSHIKSECNSMHPANSHQPFSKKLFKSMSPNSTNLPTSNSWEMTQGLSPYAPLPPLPDMQSITHHMNGNTQNGYGHNPNNGPQTPFDFHSSASDFAPLNNPLNPNSGPPLDNPLDPLAAMEKSLSQHESQMGQSFASELTSRTSTNVNNTSPGHNSNVNNNHSSPRTIGPKTPQTPAPHTPLTPGTSNVGTPNVAGTPGNGNHSDSGSNPMNNQSANSCNNSLSNDLNDLNFDPAAIIDGEGQGQEGLNLLPENCVDAMDLLSYLEPQTGGMSSHGNTSTTSVNEDILALFES